MDDTRRIRNGIHAAQDEDREIDEATARLIASQWHNGQGTLLYAFASTGKLAGTSTETWSEVADDYRRASAEDRQALDYLGTYFLNCCEVPE